MVLVDFIGCYVLWGIDGDFVGYWYDCVIGSVVVFVGGFVLGEGVVLL